MSAPPVVAGPTRPPPWWIRPFRGARRTIWPTRDGWWCLAAAVGLGAAAVNTGNNLAYLLCSMLLALVLVSGMLSDHTLRGVCLGVDRPGEVFAGQPALLRLRVANTRRRFASYSLVVEAVRTSTRRLVRPGTGARVLHVARVEAGADRRGIWEVTLPQRGRQRLLGLRLTTRFPFGLFVKAGPVLAAADVVVFPALGPLRPDRRRELDAVGAAGTRRRGVGSDLRNLRPYVPGDEPRLLHWRASAKAGVLTLRELEEEATPDARIVLDGTGAAAPERLERGLSEAAALAVHLLGAGARVELVGPGVWVPGQQGPDQRRRLLTTLALYVPPDRATHPRVAGSLSPAAREIRVPLE